MNGKLKNIKCFLLDMDGTVHLSGIAIKGAPEAIERMRKKGRVIFLTNNTSVSRLDYAQKLSKMGICAGENDIYTAGNATIEYLKSYHANKSVFLFGTDKLRAEFIREGVTLDNENPDLVVIGFDTSLTYEKLSAACAHIRSGVPYILTHPDINCPTRDGYIPDVGSFNALISLSTGKAPFIVCGKPNGPIADGIKKMTALSGNEIAMFGDRLSTDMAFAQRNGFVSALVLSGEATADDLAKSEIKADVVLESIAEWDKED